MITDCVCVCVCLVCVCGSFTGYDTTTMQLIRLWSSVMYVISVWCADTDVPEKSAAFIFRTEGALKPGNGGGRVLQKW